MIDIDKVRSTLDQIGPMKQFRVRFKKVNGEDREMICMMDVDSGKRGVSVPVMEIASGQWKAFRVDRVETLEAL
jgi:hypothetical protein